jgi:hypothetical protein
VINVSIIKNIKKIESIVPQCLEVVERSDKPLPFHLLNFPLLWYKYFNSQDGKDFGNKRGVNFFGERSWLEHFYLILAEERNRIVGFVPLVSFKIKIRGSNTNFNLLSFGGDSVLIPYKDFFTTHQNKYMVLKSMFMSIINIVSQKFDLLFLGHIPEDSTNIQDLKKIIKDYTPENWKMTVTINSRHGGLRPWTIEPILLGLKKLNSILPKDDPSFSELDQLVVDMDKLEKGMIYFPGTQKKYQNRIEVVLNNLNDRNELYNEITEVNDLLQPMKIDYPYIDLPTDRETFLASLSHETRRYFRRYKRRFIEQGGNFEKISGKSISKGDIKDYIELHSMRWQNDSVAVKEKNSLDFHIDMIREFAKRSQCTLFFATYRGMRIASHSCIDVSSRREAYFNGRNPKYNELRAGRLLYMETILDAIDNNFSIYNLGYGGDNYKMSFTKKVIKSYNFILSSRNANTDLQQIFTGYEFII